MRKVVQFSTGNVGQHSLRAIIGRPDLQRRRAANQHTTPARVVGIGAIETTSFGHVPSDILVTR